MNRRHLLVLPLAALALPAWASGQDLESVQRQALRERGVGPIVFPEGEPAIWKALLDPAARDQTVDGVIARPESVNPIAFAPVSESLWDRGQRARAAFWLYLFQARTQPWMQGGPISEMLMEDYFSALLGRPENYFAARRAWNQRAAGVINSWAMSDLDAVVALAGRVFSYESRIPLYPGRNTYVSQEVWDRTVLEKRAENVEGFRSAMAQLDRETFYAERRKLGKYVGPWQDAGPPLPDEWR
ncbi:MAG TPA: hypothetical protein VEA44_00580 [Caulobacter sp.]|nr:hypothetical protein [Caulobacter sp.]